MNYYYDLHVEVTILTNIPEDFSSLFLDFHKRWCILEHGIFTYFENEKVRIIFVKIWINLLLFVVSRHSQSSTNLNIFYFPCLFLLFINVNMIKVRRSSVIVVNTLCSIIYLSAIQIKNALNVSESISKYWLVD